MGIEIEKKFLVKNNAWRHLAEGVTCLQGYLNRSKKRTVRIRTIDGRGYIAVKGMAKGLSRPEYEYEIPLADAQDMLTHLCEKPLIEKIRYKIPHAGLIWEVDAFQAENQGLILAEIELTSEDQSFEVPEWIGEEVTGMARYLNSNLVTKPFSKW